MKNKGMNSPLNLFYFIFLPFINNTFFPSKKLTIYNDQNVHRKYKLN